jgi:hypothetical protein
VLGGALQNNVTAVLTASPTDILSHVAIRARSQVCLATSGDGWPQDLPLNLLSRLGRAARSPQRALGCGIANSLRAFKAS